MHGAFGILYDDEPSCLIASNLINYVHVILHYAMHVVLV